MNYSPDEYSKQYIVQALLALMKSYRYDKITVIDIAKKAGVGRATFYRYFKSKEDVIRFCFDHNRQKFVFEQRYYPRCAEDYKEIAATALTMFKNNKELFLLLKKADLQSLYIDYLNSSFAQTFERDYPDKDSYLPYIYAGMLFNVSMKWLEDDCKQSPQSVAETILDAIYFKTDN